MRLAGSHLGVSLWFTTNLLYAMLNREGIRAARHVRPDDHGLKADPMLRHTYGGQLESAAELFLIHAFEKGGHGPLGEGEVPPVLVSAAMHILNRSAWTQPSDEQIKAAMYLSQPPAAQSSREDADDPERRAA